MSCSPSREPGGLPEPLDGWHDAHVTTSSVAYLYAAMEYFLHGHMPKWYNHSQSIAAAKPTPTSRERHQPDVAKSSRIIRDGQLSDARQRPPHQRGQHLEPTFEGHTCSLGVGFFCFQEDNAKTAHDLQDRDMLTMSDVQDYLGVCRERPGASCISRIFRSLSMNGPTAYIGIEFLQWLAAQAKHRAQAIRTEATSVGVRGCTGSL